MVAQHAADNAMEDAGEIARFHDRCSDLMRELLDALAASADRPRPFPEIEDAIGWPRRRIASVLGGVARLRTTEFGGRRPYRFTDTRQSPSGRWEMWMDARQARAVRAAQGSANPGAAPAPRHRAAAVAVLWRDLRPDQIPPSPEVERRSARRSMSDEQGTFHVAVEREGTLVRIVVRGELDIATVPRLEQVVAPDAGAERVVLDLTGVTFIDSTGLRLLLEAHREIGARLGIRTSPACERLFEITGVRSRLPIVDG